MPFNLYLFPLLGGFYIYSRFYLFKFYQKRLDKSRLYFFSIIIGIFLMLITVAFRTLCSNLFPDFLQKIYSSFPFHSNYLGTSFSSLIIAILFTEIFNLAGGHKFKIYCLKKVIKSVGNEMELIILDAYNNSKTLLITLNNDKIYIAIPKEILSPSVSTYLRIIPFISGYRDSKKKIHFTTDYISVYRKFINDNNSDISKPEELETDIVINLADISVVSFFNFELNEIFKKVEFKERANQD